MLYDERGFCSEAIVDPAIKDVFGGILKTTLALLDACPVGTTVSNGGEAYPMGPAKRKEVAMKKLLVVLVGVVLILGVTGQITM